MLVADSLVLDFEETCMDVVAFQTRHSGWHPGPWAQYWVPRLLVKQHQDYVCCFPPMKTADTARPPLQWTASGIRSSRKTNAALRNRQPKFIESQPRRRLLGNEENMGYRPISFCTPSAVVLSSTTAIRTPHLPGAGWSL